MSLMGLTSLHAACIVLFNKITYFAVGAHHLAAIKQSNKDKQKGLEYKIKSLPRTGSVVLSLNFLMQLIETASLAHNLKHNTH